MESFFRSGRFHAFISRKCGQLAMREDLRRILFSLDKKHFQRFVPPLKTDKYSAPVQGRKVPCESLEMALRFN